MAKQPPRSGNVGKVKFRVFEFEMDGSDESIQDTMKTLAAALTRGGQGIPPSRRLKVDPAAGLPSNEPEVDDDGEGEPEDDDVQDVVVKASIPRKPKKIQTYEILNDIRFDKSEVSLSDFVAQYNLKIDLKRYLVIASWYKDQFKLPEINVRHWYTAFKYLKWTMPNDPAQPIRDLRAGKKLSKGASMGHAFINHIGEKDIEPLLKNSQ